LIQLVLNRQITQLPISVVEHGILANTESGAAQEEASVARGLARFLGVTPRLEYMAMSLGEPYAASTLSTHVKLILLITKSVIMIRKMEKQLVDTN